MICGVCGGTVRGFSAVVHGRPMKDWKHATVPPGTAPHRPVLGRPVDQATLDRFRAQARERQRDVVVHREPVGPPLVPAHRTTDVPASLTTMAELATLYGWENEPAIHFVGANQVESYVLRSRRRDCGAIAIWSAGKFSGGYTLWRRDDRAMTELVNATALKAWLKQRDERCPDCGRSSVAHDEGKCPP